MRKGSFNVEGNAVNYRNIGLRLLFWLPMSLSVLVSGGAAAQTAGLDKTCALGMVERFAPARIIPASFQVAAVPSSHVAVSYLGHSAFLVETPGGVTIVSDYNGVHVPSFAPDIVTMNRSHNSHYTNNPDPRIPHVLPGWDFEGGIAQHDVQVKDARVFNIPTNINTFDNGFQRNNNSIFVYQAGGICLAHLGHLHHYLTEEQQRQLRQVDILFVPIDGNSTMSHEEALHIIDQIKPRVVIPMHYHFGGAAQMFVARVPYPVHNLDLETLVVSKRDLPETTEVWFIPPRVGDFDGVF